MQTIITPLKDAMLKREANYLSSGISTALQIHVKERPRSEPALQPRAAAVPGNTAPATLARGHQQHLHRATTAGRWWGMSIHSPTTTAPGRLLVACLLSSLHSCFHLNCSILNERKRTKFPSVPRRGKVWATPDQGLFFNNGQHQTLQRKVWDTSELRVFTSGKMGFCLTLC